MPPARTFAQVSGAAPPPTATQSPPGNQPPTVQEIVVTSQRRAERFVEVPASVSVVTATELTASGVTGTRQLRLLTPGLNITQQGLYTQPTIRGVGTTVTGPGADPNVAIYVDGVYQANQGAALFEFNNIEQIETLKGPQGSLYGRNATGGAIVVTTKSPSLQRASGSLDVSYGRFNEVRASAYGNLPLTDKLAANIAVYDVYNDGYTRNVALNDKHSSYTRGFGFRGKLLWQPADNLRFVLTGARIHQSDNTAFSYEPFQGNTPQKGTKAAYFGLYDHSHIALNTEPSAKADTTALSLNADWSGAWGKLTSITSWASIDTPFVTDLDGTEVNFQSFVSNPQTDKTITQEFVYASPKYDRFSWIGGLYYYSDQAESVVHISVFGTPLPFPPFRPDARQDTEAYAAYAEGTLDILHNLHLTAGGRYSSEEKHATNHDGVGGVLMLDARHTWTAFTPHIALRYDITADSSAYLNYSEGFKSGLFDAGNTGACTKAAFGTPACPSAGVPVQPEKVRAYEGGLKYNMGSTVLSAAAYYNKYKNIQINALNALNQQVLYNAAAAEIYGFDFEVSKRLVENLTVHAGGAYTHSKYTKFPLGQNFTPLPGGGNAQVTADDAGHQLVRSPDFTTFVTASYDHDLPTGSMDASATVSYSDSYFWNVDNRLKQPAFTIVNARFSWLSPDRHWTVSVFGDNLTDERTMVYVREAVVGDLVSWSKPRSFGVGVGVSF